MLTRLSIRNVVLIEALDLEFHHGLNVLTGETGAGKSILLDALGFALGRKVRRDLVRAGADSASVTACFRLGPDHPAHEILAALDLAAEDGEVILRRTARPDGPSRGFVNDQRTSGPALADLGAALVEVHGQHDDRGLLDPKAHKTLLDAFGGLEERATAVRAAWSARNAAQRALEAAEREIADAAADREYLEHAAAELEALAPEEGEDAALDTERRRIQHAGRIREEVARADVLIGADGAEAALADAIARLGHVADRADGSLEAPLAALDRAMTELGEAQAGVAAALDVLTFDPGRLELVEERLFALRALARKHGVQPDDLADLATQMVGQLDALDAGEDRLTALRSALAEAEAVFDGLASALSDAREKAGSELDTAVTAELAPLRMEGARFHTAIQRCDPGQDGIDRVSFTAAINRGTPAGPIDRIASGGELSRFLLALKVCLAARAAGRTMVFDEIDRGVGGATADAVGRRLARLARASQVLVVTHSPQVAARATRHWRIAKGTDAGVTRTDVQPLDDGDRLDEIARMLAGETITPEARSAARALVDQAETI